MHGPKIILGSGSPRRRELLKLLDMEAEIMVSDKETELDDPNPVEACTRQAVQKGEDIFKKAEQKYPDGNFLVLAADTVVSIDGQILGKPRDRADAKRMLQMYSGKTHQVYTAVFLADGRDKAIYHFVECTDIAVCAISDAEIEEYLDKNEYTDKAGACEIQGAFGKFVSGIHGDYYNIMGMPIAKLYQDYKKLWQIR